ncbi:hypothetical protein SDC9_190171 [bioreactor metagenome]|uniref:Uncharacterized protein n=1 Tax=bioreactor metagenome TaxID=1076179 RepID=A0A645I2C3_9ZZZZ
MTAQHQRFFSGIDKGVPAGDYSRFRIVFPACLDFQDISRNRVSKGKDIPFPAAGNKAESSDAVHKSRKRQTGRKIKVVSQSSQRSVFVEFDLSAIKVFFHASPLFACFQTDYAVLPPEKVSAMVFPSFDRQDSES